MMSTIVGFENPAYASPGDSVPDSTAAATARTAAVRIGKAPITTDKIVAAKMANRCQACALKVPGGGTTQIPRATASAITRAIRVRRDTGGAMIRLRHDDPNVPGLSGPPDR